MYKDILTILAEIKSAKGNAKHPLIVKYLDENELFAKVVKYTLDTSKTFKIRKVPYNKVASSYDLWTFLDGLNEQRGATGDDRYNLSCIASASPYKWEVVNRILSKKLDCGCTVKTLNKLLPGFVPYFPYMRCSGLDKINNIVFPCFSQLKADGEYFDIFVPEDDKRAIVPQTRNGKWADFSAVADVQELPKMEGTDYKISGEALLLKKDGSGYEKRKDGNAIINKALYGLLSQEEAERIHFSFWDIVFKEHSELDYDERWDDLHIIGNAIIGNAIECRVVCDIEEAWKHYDEVRLHDLEGTILKNFKGKWKDGTSPNQIKLKAMKECELEVIGIMPGEGKYEGMVGSLMCKSSCGKLVTDIGMGLSDADRRRGDWVGQIITARFNEVSKSKVKDTCALVHTRLVDDRPDKNEADNLEYIKNVKEVKRGV